MMLSRVEAGKKVGDDSGNRKLLNEIETISKALYLEKNPSRSSISRVNNRSKSSGKTHLPDPQSKLKPDEEDPSRKEKKSIWNWRPLKALSHIRNRRFNCCFSLVVHSIEGLPSSFNDFSLCVHWKRRDGVLVTRPVKVLQGMAEFEEKLTHTCSVYGSRNGPHHSAKYEAKHFLLYASVYGVPELDLGKHRVDLTRLLPLTLEELEEEKSSGTWTTDFKLAGKAKGALMNVSFGYLVIGDNPSAPRSTGVLTSRQNSPFGLSSESEPESPRERLLRQFEEEALAGGCSLFDFSGDGEGQAESGRYAPTGSVWGNLSELSSVVQDAEEEPQIASHAEKSKTRAKMLEDLETEALMREWGLNENAFQHSPPKSSDGFGSPIDLPPEGPVELPSLGEGLGPFLQTKNGGFVRSMDPSLFNNAKSGGNLIMQVSSPVVVPAEMGSETIEILQRLASVGIEKLSMQANKLMPLEDITGKTMQQVAWEAAPSLEGPERQSLLQHESAVGQDTFGGQKRVKGRSAEPESDKFSSSLAGNGTGSEYVSLEDLAPLAMHKIEALSMEGLRIQSGMSDEDAPVNISAQPSGEISALQGKGINISGSLGLDGAAGLQLLDIKDGGDDVDGLIGLSLSLDEWMRLDSGEIEDEDRISERTSKILAAHHANSLDSIRGGSKGERRRGKGSSKKCGLLGNNFTVALMVQLRDPLRNYEQVGAPMLALIQVERVFLPPKPKIYSTVPLVRNIDKEDDESESSVKETKEEIKEAKTTEEEVPQFRIAEVHVAGLKTEPGKKKLWGSSTQQQSGSRWLLANGMGKSNKHPFMKSKSVAKSAVPATTKVQPGDTLWSISSRVHGTGTKWKELAALNPHIRNPNIILPNETIRLR
ncbi:hypothetical protein I3842_03G199600 [Carya illinoinensis]|uniref:Uncharacterized protein n=1 Tax=Carya illinoinensis TaxID=32201 RepID=A0A922K113_CARIL|nr:hypothetical protein I3842_03G199600 [Carya illinoinensis]